MDHDVLIAGAGIAGAACAALLADSGLRVCVVDPAPAAPCPPLAQHIDEVDPRVSAISPASQLVLEAAGAWTLIPAELRAAYTGMEVWEQDGTGRIRFDAVDIDETRLGHIIENRWLTHALSTRLSALSNARLISGERVEAFQWDAASASMMVSLSNGQSVQVGLLVGADGARSTIRQLAGIGTRTTDTGQSGIVATLRTSAAHEATAWQRFLPTGPLAYLPLNTEPTGHVSSIVWSAEQALADTLMALDDAAFGERVGAALEHRLGTVEAVSKRFAFPLRQLHADSYSAPGLVLVGDAAHVIHPLAGQGINLGLADVMVLSDELQRARRRSLALADAGVLGRYQRRRRGENALMLQAMTGFRLLFGADHPAIRLLRNAGVSAVDGLRPLKLRFMRHAMGM